MSDDATFAVVDLGNTLRQIRAESTDEEWRDFMDENWPGEDRFVGLVMKFAQDMSDDPAYRNPGLAQVLMDSGTLFQLTGKSGFHGMPAL